MRVDPIAYGLGLALAMDRKVCNIFGECVEQSEEAGRKEVQQARKGEKQREKEATKYLKGRDALAPEQQKPLVTWKVGDPEDTERVAREVGVPPEKLHEMARNFHNYKAHDAEETVVPAGGANAETHGAAHATERAEIAGKTGITGGPPTRHPTDGGGAGLTATGHMKVPDNIDWPSKDAEPDPHEEEKAGIAAEWRRNKRAAADRESELLREPGEDQRRELTHNELAELYNLYHLARTALAGESPSQYDRKLWATKEFAKLHPDIPSKWIYLGFEQSGPGRDSIAGDAKAFPSWKEAHTAAVQLARQLGREVGIERTKEYGKEVYLVHHLPNPGNRYGFELRVEVVKPTDPL